MAKAPITYNDPSTPQGNAAYNGQVAKPPGYMAGTNGLNINSTVGQGVDYAGAQTSYNASQAGGANDPYRGGLLTSYTGSGQSNAAQGDRDPDEAGLAALTNEDAAARAGQNDGVDYAHNSALENVYQGRIGEKNSLAEEIGAAPGLLTQQQDVNKAVSGQALGQGLKETRQNFNNRGLLYSGAREGGEQSVKNQGASDLANSMAGSARDSANSTTAAKNAYASVDLASQQQTLNLATQSFDTANANNIARLQAMQQLGSGVGAAAGTIAGSYNPSTTNPTTNWQPEQLQQPQIGSQYSGQTSYSVGR